MRTVPTSRQNNSSFRVYLSLAIHRICSKKNVIREFNNSSLKRAATYKIESQETTSVDDFTAADGLSARRSYQ
jgi:hypothetical protein